MYPTHLRWSRRAVASAAGLALAITVSAAPAIAETAPSGFSRSTASTPDVVPLTADLLITRTIVDADGQQRIEHETNRLYRDSQGRTRTEDGSSVTISDPAAGTTIVLDTRAGTFQRFTSDQSDPDSAAPRPDGTTASNRQVTSTPRPLGEAVISGVQAQGKAYTVTTPARESFPSREREVTTWSSPEVQLPVRTRVVEDSGEVYEQTYTNIRAGSEPAAALFRVPAGYQDASLAAASLARQLAAAGTTEAGTAQANCPISYFDPIVVVTWYPFPVWAPVPAATDGNLGCIFVADALLYLEWPLQLFPDLPLGLPVDNWIALYSGDPVPWLPWTAFGVVGFAAASTGDATVVDSLVILEIF